MAVELRTDEDESELAIFTHIGGFSPGLLLKCTVSRAGNSSLMEAAGWRQQEDHAVDN